jgi:hypothetical protein
MLRCCCVVMYNHCEHSRGGVAGRGEEGLGGEGQGEARRGGRSPSGMGDMGASGSPTIRVDC